MANGIHKKYAKGYLELVFAISFLTFVVNVFIISVIGGIGPILLAIAVQFCATIYLIYKLFLEIGAMVDEKLENKEF